MIMLGERILAMKNPVLLRLFKMIKQSKEKMDVVSPEI
jgi:hypothetical protein